jgi:hypothetical protein
MSSNGHYRAETGIQAYQVIEAWQLTFNMGCVLKYCCRAGYKPGESVESDIRKALEYVDFEIDFLDRVVSGRQVIVLFDQRSEIYCSLKHMPDEVADVWAVDQLRRTMLNLIFTASVKYREGNFAEAIRALEDLIPCLLEVSQDG